MRLWSNSLNGAKCGIMVKLILASASPKRLELLRQIGIQPDLVFPTDVDETPLARERPRELANRLARLKLATAIDLLDNHKNQEDYHEAVIITADTVVSVGRRILPKATTIEECLYCLNMISGVTHRVRTAVVVSRRSSNKAKVRITETRVTFKRLSTEEMQFYVDSNEWSGKAGGYSIHGIASGFIVKIVGSYNGVSGLPLVETKALIEGEGYCFHRGIIDR